TRTPAWEAAPIAATTAAGTVVGTGTPAGDRASLTMAAAVGEERREDPFGLPTRRWEYARWTSAFQEAAEPATELVVSWNADTPPGTWLRVEVRARRSDGADTPWYRLADWAADDRDISPASAARQSDGPTAVATDTLAVTEPASGMRLTGYRLRLTLHRAPGHTTGPRVRRAGVMTSAVPVRTTAPPTEPGVGRGVELGLTGLSQYTHTGRYPRYDGGGRAWCSPTSVRMVLAHWGRHPEPGATDWVDRSYDDPDVCHAARRTYDHRYAACGNWPFNTAYAASHPGMNAVVTRLGSLTDVEELVAAGIPVITSQSFADGELPGAGYQTAGHLMVVSGFTADGDVVAHDPAGRTNARVRRVYPRRAFETVWLRTRAELPDGRTLGGSGGVCYLLWPDDADSRQRHALARAGVR
ncbi:peptidase C39 family protein, partial [Streptomyces sp. SM12]|uniref:peptidase C39 family protein n=1 Tax=Streptomyces sp. SM12 TaxID=1071602 RepID=UPI0027E47818